MIYFLFPSELKSEMYRFNKRESNQQDPSEISFVKSCFSRPIVVSISMIVTQHSGDEGGGRRRRLSEGRFVKNQPGASGGDLLSLTMTLFVRASQNIKKKT